MQQSVLNLSRWLPLPDSTEGLVRIATSILNRSLTYVDEAILSYAVYRDEENVWASARHGVLLYAQRYKPILITAAKVWLLDKVIGFLVFLVYLGIFGLVAWAIGNPVASVVCIILALVATWGTMQTLFEPYALAYTLTTYHHEIAGVVPDPEWDTRLSGVSEDFRKLAGKAKEQGDAPLRFTPAPAPTFGDRERSHPTSPGV